MYIKRIKLKNFGSYAQAEFEFPNPTSERNLVLVNAQNGHGKTTLLEAIYLCLFDQDAIQYFQRAGLGGSYFKYKEFISKALHHGATDKYQPFYEMAVEIDLMEHYPFGEQGIRIVRCWRFDTHGRYEEENNEVRLWFINKGEQTPLKGDDIQDYLADYSFPAQFSQFFFFDGEQVVNYSQQLGTGVWMNNAFNGLVGVDFLVKLKDELATYSRRVFSERANQSQRLELEKNELAQQVAEIELNDVEREAATLLQQKLELESQRDELLGLVKGANSAGDSRVALERLQECENRLESVKEQFWQALVAMPLMLLPEKDITALDKQLQADFARLTHEQQKEDSEYRVEDFLNAFASNKNALEVLGPRVLNDPLLQQALRESWDKLWVLPENASDPMKHNYLSKEIFQAAQTHIARIGAPNEKLDELNKRKWQAEQEQEVAERQYQLAKNSNTDDLYDQLETTKRELADISKAYDGKNMEVGAKQSKLKDAQNRLNELSREMMSSQSGQEKSQRAAKLSQMIDDLSEKLRHSKLDEYRKKASTLHHQIAHDKQFSDISIRPDGSLQLLSQNKTPIDFKKLSHGEKKALVFTLICALAEITDNDVPFVVDTPFASLDPEHRANLLRYWRKLKRQVIILSQPSEITSDVYREISENISCAYTVTAKVLKGGGKLSTVSQGAKF